MTAGAGPIGPDDVVTHPQTPCGTGVLVLSGSSGRVDVDRCRLLSAHGAVALGMRWFGGPGQQPAPYEVPVEGLVDALEVLERNGCARIAVIGTSFGAEAALVLATLDPRVQAVVAMAPTSVVWAGVAPTPDGGGRQTSHWTWRGRPLPYVPHVEDWQPTTDPPAYRTMYQRSLSERPESARAAAIAVERIPDVVVVGGEDDQVWPGADFARAIGARRSVHGLVTTVVTLAGAGHRPCLPGEPEPAGGQVMSRGGTPERDRALGVLAWPHVVRALGLRP